MDQEALYDILSGKNGYEIDGILNYEVKLARYSYRRRSAKRNILTFNIL